LANAEGEGRGQEEIAAVKRLQAFELRRRGKPYREIAKTLDVSVATAHTYVQSVLDELHEQTKAHGKKYVEMELERLDRMYDAIAVKADEGDASAQEMALKILSRRSKYLGLDSPDQLNVTGSVSIAQELKRRRDLANEDEPVVDESDAKESKP